jgi:ankyrin repeat protein
LINASSSDQQQQSLLQIALVNGQPEVARLLVEQGADVNYVDQARRSVLFLAAEKCNTETVRFLLERGANDQPDFYFGSAIFGAASAANVVLVRLLAERGADIHQRVLGAGTLLHTAAFHDATEVIDFLLDAGMDVNLDGRGDSGNCPLHSAVSANKPNAVRSLLERGADPRIENYRGETPWEIAHRSHRWEGDFAPSDPAEVERERVANQEIVQLLQRYVQE